VVAVVVVGVVVTVVVVGVVVVVDVVEVHRRRRRRTICTVEAAWADGCLLVACLRRAGRVRRGCFAVVLIAGLLASVLTGRPWTVTARAAAGPQQAAASAATTGRSLQERMHPASVSAEEFHSHRRQVGHVSDRGSGHVPDGHLDARSSESVKPALCRRVLGGMRCGEQQRRGTQTAGRTRDLE
jgi:hypothetical protein